MELTMRSSLLVALLILVTLLTYYYSTDKYVFSYDDIKQNEVVPLPIDITALNSSVCPKQKTDNTLWSHLCEGGNNIVREAVNFLTKSSNKKSKVAIVQIGAHVGFEPNDPIANGIMMLMDKLPQEYRKNFKWTFVEPSPPNYKRLIQNLEKYRHVCELLPMNVGVIPDVVNETQAKNMVFYSIRDTIDPETGYDSISHMTFPYWITQVSSFSKNAVMMHHHVFSKKGLKIEDYIVETNVNVKPFSDVMFEAVGTSTFTSPLLVLIDTEGFDCDIILGISPQSKYLPKFIVFEHKNCRHKYNDVAQHLMKMGYSVIKVSIENAVAILNK